MPVDSNQDIDLPFTLSLSIEYPVTKVKSLRSLDIYSIIQHLKRPSPRKLGIETYWFFIHFSFTNSSMSMYITILLPFHLFVYLLHSSIYSAAKWDILQYFLLADKWDILLHKCCFFRSNTVFYVWFFCILKLKWKKVITWYFFFQNL